MKTNARAAAAALLLGGMLGVPASPVFSTDVGTSTDTFTDGSGNSYSSTRASALSTGMDAPNIDVGSSTVLKGTVQYTNSTGTSDAFSVGTSTSINASVSASSTPDYSVNSVANFGIGGSKINQVIGTSGTNNSSSQSTATEMASLASDTAESQANSDFTLDSSSRGGYWWWNRRNNTRKHVSDESYESTKSSYVSSLSEDITKTLEDSQGQSGTISGVFKKVDGTGSLDGMSSNEVTVKGIGANNEIAAASSSVTSGGTTSATGFNTGITKLTGSDAVSNTGAGTASGSAAGNVSTTASANANSSQYVSSFAQAY